jgi:hypothetical protein
MTSLLHMPGAKKQRLPGLKVFRTMFNVTLSLFILALFVRGPLAAAGEHELNRCPFVQKDTQPICTYPRYLCSYYDWQIRKPDSLATIRPLTEMEFQALALATEFIHDTREASESIADKEFLDHAWEEITSLIKEGRIKCDDDPEEVAIGTQMSTHAPQDPSDPYQGDIYVHAPGLLQTIYLPLAGIEKLGTSSIPEERKKASLNNYQDSIIEGKVLLSSYLVHECRHRRQKKILPREAGEAKTKNNRSLLEMEDPAYTEQYTFLSILSRSTNNKNLKKSIKSVTDTLVKEVNSKFPGLEKFKDAQKRGE